MDRLSSVYAPTAVGELAMIKLRNHAFTAFCITFAFPGHDGLSQRRIQTIQPVPLHSALHEQKF